MPNNPSIQDTILLVQHAFGGLRDKGGELLSDHCLRVWHKVGNQGPTTQHAALLHDIVEDTHVDQEYLKSLNYSAEVRHAVWLLTHDRKEMDYQAYIDRLCESEFTPAILVKIADQEDNRDPRRWMSLNRYQQRALTKKWEGVPEKLNEALKTCLTTGE